MQLLKEVSPKTQIWFAVLIVSLYIIALTVGHLYRAPWYDQHAIAAMVGGFISIASYRWRHRRQPTEN